MSSVCQRRPEGEADQPRCSPCTANTRESIAVVGRALQQRAAAHQHHGVDQPHDRHHDEGRAQPDTNDSAASSATPARVPVTATTGTKSAVRRAVDIRTDETAHPTALMSIRARLALVEHDVGERDVFSTSGPIAPMTTKTVAIPEQQRDRREIAAQRAQLLEGGCPAPAVRLAVGRSWRQPRSKAHGDERCDETWSRTRFRGRRSPRKHTGLNERP